MAAAALALLLALSAPTAPPSLRAAHEVLCNVYADYGIGW